jgi:hypothetical protein
MTYSDDERADQDRATLYARIKELEAALEPYCKCPRCGESSVCWPGCQFAELAPVEAERMSLARAVRWGK